MGIVAQNRTSVRKINADLDFIRTTIPIAAVAADLGLECSGNMFRCFRPDAHQHGDRTPSMGKARKNRLKCFVCDVKPLSNIDLVMKVLDISTADAIAWLAQRFPGIPATKKGKHIDHAQRWGERSRIGASASQLEYIIRSGVWASFSQAEKSLLPVLDMFADEKRTVTISYRGMMRYSGIGSSATISVALRTFQKLHLVQIQKATKDGLRACGVYILTFDDPDFVEHAFGVQSHLREQISTERSLRTKSREYRRKKLDRSLLPVSTLSSPTELVTKITVQSECSVKKRTSDIQGVTA